jgi:hypothetical protein
MPNASVITTTDKGKAPSVTEAEDRGSTSKEEEEGEEEDLLAYAEEDILFYQLRSRATKALCKLMTHPGSSPSRTVNPVISVPRG